MPLCPIVLRLGVPSHLRPTYGRCSAKRTVTPCAVRLTSGITMMSSHTRQPSQRSCTMERCRVTALGRPNRWRCSIAGWIKDPRRELLGARLTGSGHSALTMVLEPRQRAHSEFLGAVASHDDRPHHHGPGRRLVSVNAFFGLWSTQVVEKAGDLEHASDCGLRRDNGQMAAALSHSLGGCHHRRDTARIAEAQAREI